MNQFDRKNNEIYEKKVVSPIRSNETKGSSILPDQNLKVLNAHLMTFSKQLSSIHQRLDYKKNQTTENQIDFSRVIFYCLIFSLILSLSYLFFQKISHLESTIQNSNKMMTLQRNMVHSTFIGLKNEQNLKNFQEQWLNSYKNSQSLLESLSQSVMSVQQTTQRLPQIVSNKMNESLKNERTHIQNIIQKELFKASKENSTELVAEDNHIIKEYRILFKEKQFEELIHEILDLLTSSNSETLDHKEIIYYYLISSYYQLGFIDTALKWCEKSIVNFKDKRVLKILIKSKTVDNLIIEPYFRYLLNF